MPHIIIEHSANIANHGAAHDLLRRVHRAAIASSLFDPDAVRTRAAVRDQYLVGATEDPLAGFVLITVRLRPGRGAEALEALAKSLMKAVLEVFREAGYSHPLLLNVEIQELPPVRVGARLNME